MSVFILHIHLVYRSIPHSILAQPLTSCRAYHMRTSKTFQTDAIICLCANQQHIGTPVCHTEKRSFKKKKKKKKRRGQKRLLWCRTNLCFHIVSGKCEGNKPWGLSMNNKFIWWCTLFCTPHFLALISPSGTDWLNRHGEYTLGNRCWLNVKCQIRYLPLPRYAEDEGL